MFDFDVYFTELVAAKLKVKRLDSIFFAKPKPDYV